ncbi:MAG: riboflavin synthase [Niabella sp.]|nr:MAG: riboflavin synthase [Niabella sp.]
MFTGIIENIGLVKEIINYGTGKTFVIESSLSNELKIDQSISHNGVCLTVEKATNGTHTVTAIEETLKKTNLNSLAIGDPINLERCMVMNGRLDGHIVQGHVDTTVQCLSIVEKDGSWEFQFNLSPAHSPLVIEKGSVCINGISLTAFDVEQNNFKVAIIPYTFNNTNIKNLRKDDWVNIEFDVIGKYILRMKDVNENQPLLK